MLRKLLLLTIGCTVMIRASAQTFPVSGTVSDGTTSLVGVTILVNDQTDSTKRNGVITDPEGRFSFPALSPGAYRLRATIIGYQTTELQFRVDSQAVDLAGLRLVENARQLKEVTIIGQQLRVEQKGDTVQYNAGAFKTNPDASAEDLIKKLPGVTIENGTVKTQGEDVKRVLIDGKPFFGDDPSLALRNLPAEVIDRIQVFDRLSDQSQFTGFDDGNTDKTINIITKPGRNNGQFGKVYAGFGNDRSDDPTRYSAGGNVNFFKGDRRISVLGLSNNINQQNFSNQDLLGALGGTQRQGGGGGGPRGGGGQRGGGGNAPGGSGNRGGGDASNFLVGQQGGITGTTAFGLNYSDTWGKKVAVTGSYFFNDTRNISNTLLGRTYFASGGQSQFYDEDEQTAANNNNHRLNFRLEYKINPNNSLIITPQMSWQRNRSTNAFTGVNTLSEGVLLSKTTSENMRRSQGYNFSNTAVFQHRFAKQGRTFSIGLTTSFKDQTRDNRLQSQNEFFTAADSTLIINQQSNSFTSGNTLSGNFSYTEPMRERGQLQLTYSPSLTNGDTDKETYNLIGTNGSQIRRPDTTLSNTFNSQYLSQRAGASYRLRGKSWQFSAGLFYQNASLTGDQTFPWPFEVRKTFDNLLPTAMF
ncbi:MAG: TonB-dependent receptor family protein, partial [Cytophagaceae bacterium]|nr:TonB-dependent receptor family protein [Cytophagaceae bacterium]